MTRVWSVLFAICIFASLSLPGSRNDVQALGSQLLSPKAAQQYAADSDKAANGDPDAAYRIGELFASGRLGGLKDLKKALSFYRLAAQKGHQDAAARVAQIESELRKGEGKHASSVLPSGH
jgi:TPR repeat protein